MSEIPPGQVEISGKRYMPDAKGALVPVELVKPQHRLQDEMVREIFALAEVEAVRLSELKARAFDQLDQLQQLLEQNYGVKARGEKGNQTYYSYDGLQRIVVQVADLIRFGPELQAAKALIDECFSEWSADAHPMVRAFVARAFSVDKEGQVNRGALLALKRYEVEDLRWQRAMTAIADSVQVIDTKPYIRFSKRSDHDGAWENVSLNIATAPPPPSNAPAHAGDDPSAT
jgi:hypothetical protein